MKNILHYVAFDPATQTLRCEANFNCSSNLELFSKKPSEHQELFTQLLFTVKIDKKMLEKLTFQENLTIVP